MKKNKKLAEHNCPLTALPLNNPLNPKHNVSGVGTLNIQAKKMIQ